MHPASLKSDYTELSYDRDMCTAASGTRRIHMVETKEKASKQVASGENREGKERENGKGGRSSEETTGGAGRSSQD